MEFLISPIINALIVLYSILGNSFPLAIVVVTLAVRLVTLPLTLPQQRSTRKMQALQPELEKLKKKHGKNRQAMSEAQMKLYREHGVNPLGGCLPLILQLVVMIALYQSIIGALAFNPLQMLTLSQRVGASAASLLPINSNFLWLNLGQPDPFFVLPALVFITTYFQQKVMTPPSTGDGTAAATSRQMGIIMPVMLGFFALSFASGLSIYFIVSNLIGVVQYYFIGQRLSSESSTPSPRKLGKASKAGTKAKTNGKK